ncbi:MAG: hypothetical protein ABSC94_27320 [Polyangiaceae bacterium]|jgi:hypothetical protein
MPSPHPVTGVRKPVRVFFDHRAGRVAARQQQPRAMTKAEQHGEWSMSYFLRILLADALRAKKYLHR